MTRGAAALLLVALTGTLPLWARPLPAATPAPAPAAPATPATPAPKPGAWPGPGPTATSSPGAAASQPAPAPTPPPLPAGLSESRFMAVERAVTAAMARLGIPGLTVAIAHASAPEVAWSRGYGLADVENDVPAAPSTMYRLASVSKPVTAIAVMQLHEQGRVDLDAPIQRYVPAFPEKPWPLSARRLLAHQGGVRHIGAGEWGSTRHYGSVVEALDVFKDDPLLAEPGTRVHYSTYGYNLLGAAVEGAAGTSYLDYLRTAVFSPAAVEGIRNDDPYVIVRRRANGYRRRASGELVNSVLADTSNKVPGGGLLGTAGDVARLGAALLGGKLLKPATLALMLAPQKLKNGQRTEFTLGFRATSRRRQREIWHHGGQPRVSNFFYLLPERGIVVVLLTNLEGVAPALLDVARDVVDVAFDAPAWHAQHGKRES